MQHILLKIFNRKFTWKISKSYDDKGDTLIHRHASGRTTKRLYSNDFRKLANAMDKAGVKTINFVIIDDSIQLEINS